MILILLLKPFVKRVSRRCDIAAMILRLMKLVDIGVG